MVRVGPMGERKDAVLSKLNMVWRRVLLLTTSTPPMSTSSSVFWAVTTLGRLDGVSSGWAILRLQPTSCGGVGRAAVAKPTLLAGSMFVAFDSGLQGVTLGVGSAIAAKERTDDLPLLRRVDRRANKRVVFGHVTMNMLLS